VIYRQKVSQFSDPTCIEGEGRIATRVKCYWPSGHRHQ